MIIKRICFPIKTLGPGNRVGIWVTGCEKKCKGCMSPELRKMENGYDVPIEKIKKTIESIEGVEGITISGGEPFLQVEEIQNLVTSLSDYVNKDILIYTGYRLDEIERNYPEQIKIIKDNISSIIDGEYIEELNNGRGLMGSENQTIHIFSNEEKYYGARDMVREGQIISYGNTLLYVGLQNSNEGENGRE